MRRLRNILMLASSCCLLFFTTSCGTNEPVQDYADPVHDATSEGNDPAQPAVPQGGDQAPVGPGVVSVPVVNGQAPVGPRGPGARPNGGGGGSQGAEEPARTGNPDKDKKPLAEANCIDGIDNDGDGFIDCLDTDCQGKSCSDGNGCSTGDVCNNSICTGVAVNCNNIVGNECSVDVCVAESPNTFYCSSTLDSSKTEFDSCTPTFARESRSDNCSVREPDGSCLPANEINSCIIGRCEQQSDDVSTWFECVAGDKGSLAIEDGGCADDNPCTGDICLDSSGACEYAILDGILCDGEFACTTGDVCQQGECVPGVVLPNDCSIDADCGIGSFCIEGGCTCDDDNECTSDTTCSDGFCGDGGTNPAPNCDDNPCTIDSCPNNICTSVPTSGGACDDGIGCTEASTCINGICGGGTPYDPSCPSDSVCRDCTCSVTDDCVCTNRNVSTQECLISLPTLLNIDLGPVLNGLLALVPACEIGLNLCVDGEVNALCQYDAAALDECTGESLDDACDTILFTTGLSAAVGPICAALQVALPIVPVK